MQDEVCLAIEDQQMMAKKAMNRIQQWSVQTVEEAVVADMIKRIRMVAVVQQLAELVEDIVGRDQSRNQEDKDHLVVVLEE